MIKKQHSWEAWVMMARFHSMAAGGSHQAGRTVGICLAGKSHLYWLEFKVVLILKISKWVDILLFKLEILHH